MGGQTGLNLSVELAEAGVLDKYGVELIGAKLDAIKKAEDRLLFKDAMRKIGLDDARVRSWSTTSKDGLAFAERIGYPVILRPSFTLGGTGGGIAYNREELIEILDRGLDLSPVHEVLIEESVLGWKEFELEVMRDLADNAIIICSIENFDPMGVHTGDSITVAPAQTLTDREYQMMRDGALRCLREIGVDTGGSNVQFAINPANGPHGDHRDEPARLAQLGAGLQGHRLPHRQDRRQARRGLPARRDHQRHHPQDARLLRAHHRLRGGEDPALAVREIPRRRPRAGHADEVGRRGDGHRAHLQGGALAKGMRSLETGKAASAEVYDEALIPQRLITPTPERLAYIRFALRRGYTVEQIQRDDRHRPLVPAADQGDHRPRRRNWRRETWRPATPRAAARAPSATASPTPAWPAPGAPTQLAVRSRRKELGIRAVFNRVDTCAAEFESFTPYLYSSYESECEAEPVGPQEGHDPGQRPQPHRAGHRVRLLLLPRLLRAAGVRLRVDHGQLQPGDRLDRLRHQRPPLLRAAHARGRAEHLRHARSPTASSCSSAGRRR